MAANANEVARDDVPVLYSVLDVGDLDELAASGKVQSFGRGRARRWMTPPIPGFTTTLLLPAPLPSG